MKFKITLSLMVLGWIGAPCAFAEVRACDAYIAQYCSNSDDKGPGCLKGHEGDVSSDCLEDMQRGPGPGHGGPKGRRGAGGQPPSSSNSQSSSDAGSASPGN